MAKEKSTTKKTGSELQPSEDFTSFAEKSCGLIMPIAEMGDYSKEHWTEVKEILISVTENLGISDCEVVSINKSGGLIHGNIVNNLFEKDLIICDVSGKNPNVLFELGLRLAFDKPTIIIKDDATNYMFDTSPLFHLPYLKSLRFSAINKFKSELAAMITAVFTDPESERRSFIKHFKIQTVAKLDVEEVTQQEYFESEIRHIKSMISSLHYDLAQGRANILPQTSRSYFFENKKNSGNQFSNQTKDYHAYIEQLIETDIASDPELTTEKIQADDQRITNIATTALTQFNMPLTSVTIDSMKNIVRKMLESWM